MKASTSWFNKVLKRKRDEAEDEEQIFAKTKRLLTSVFYSSDVPPPPEFPIVLVNAAVKKLYDGHVHIGTFVFLAEHIGISCFHSVVDGRLVKQDTLSVDNCTLTHVISYPFYDVSFFYCGSQAHEYLKLDIGDAVSQGTNVIMASYPDLYSSVMVDDEEPDLAYGRVCRRQHILPDSPLVAAHYTSFPGSSGGAVLSSSGKLLGMHAESLYYEAPYKASVRAKEFRMQSEVFSRHVSEDSVIRYPSLDWSLGRRSKVETNRLKNEDVDTLAGYATINIQHKSCVAGYLPVGHIRMKLINAKQIVNEEILGIDTQE